MSPKNTILLIALSSLYLAESIHGALWSGTITTTASFRLEGTVDYIVDTTTDTMTLSNKTGDWATEYGPVATTTLYALDDTTSAASSLFGPTESSFDVLDAMFEIGAETGLGMVAGDGFYWASSTNDFYFHTIIGATNSSLANPIIDYNPGTSNGILDWARAAGSSDDLLSSQVSATVYAVPEANLSLLLIFSSLLLWRRKLFHNT